ncbi:MAG: carbohydrate-binding protein, partial [Clostridiales bacterium]|nr:carbohydrate-binding protein [Clostridiales bacterium]
GKDGVLKALRDGDVRVTATALDGSGESASLDIAISNQGALVPVTGITVTGAGGAAAITAKSRALQMSAEIAPSDATVAKVEWSAYNKAGAQEPALAAIDPSSGLLSPLYDGVVTVRATATDGSGVYGEADIAISGQNPVALVPISAIDIQLLSGSQALSAAAATATVKATVAPPAATATVDWRIAATEDLSASSPNATISVDSATGVATITAKYSGTFSVVASTTNGGTGVAVQASMPFTATGFEEASINPYNIVKAVSYASASSGLKQEGPSGDPLLGGTSNNSWALYQNVDFGLWGSQDLIIQGVNANSGGAAAAIQVREGSNTGALLGTINFAKKADSSWNYDYWAQTFTPTGALLGLTGLHNICFVFTNGSITFYSWQFTEADHAARDPYIVNPVYGADSVASGAAGYLNFDFGEPGSKKVIITGSTQNAPATVEIRDGSATGAILASLNFPDTSGSAQGVEFKLYGAAIKRGHHLYLTYPATGFELESVQFIRLRPDVVSAYQVFEAEDFDEEPSAYSIGNYADANGAVQTVLNVTDTSNGAFIYNGLDFGAIGSAKLRVCGHADGDRLLRLNIWGEDIYLAPTEGSGYAVWEYYIVGVTGVHDVEFNYYPGMDFGIDWFEFVELPNELAAAAFTVDGAAVGSLADAAGKALGVEVLINSALLPQGGSINAVIAVYDSAGRLQALQSGKMGAYRFDIPADADGMAVKVFFWDDRYIPVAGAIQFN